MAKRNGRRNPRPAATLREQNKNKSKSSSRTFQIPQPTIRKPRQQALRDVNLAYDPLLEDIAAQQNQIRDEFKENDAAYRNIGLGLDAALDNIPQFGEKYEGIADDVRRHTNQTARNFQQFAEMEQPVGQDFATGGLPPEYAKANAQALGNLGGMSQDTQELLGLMRADQTGYNRSVRNQAAIGLGNRRANALQEMQDAIAQLRQGRLDILEDRPEEVLSRTDELRRGQFDQRTQSYQAQLAAKEQASNEEMRQWALNYFKNKLANRGNNGGGGSMGGGGNWSGPGKTGTGTSNEGGGNFPKTGNAHEGTGRTGGNGRAYPQDLIDKLTGNDQWQDNEILRMFQSQYGYHPGADAEIFMRDGRVYVRQHPDAPARVINSPRADDIRRKHNKEARRVERIRTRGTRGAGRTGTTSSAEGGRRRGRKK